MKIWSIFSYVFSCLFALLWVISIPYLLYGAYALTADTTVSALVPLILAGLLILVSVFVVGIGVSVCTLNKSKDKDRETQK